MFFKVFRILLIIGDAFLALTAIAGGIGLLTNLIAPPTSDLQGSLFHNYVVPGLSLMLIVGGGALVGTLLLSRRNPWALLVAEASGVVIIGFEMVEILVIGSPAGLARSLQVFYISLGLGIIVLSGALLAGEAQVARRA